MATTGAAQAESHTQRHSGAGSEITTEPLVQRYRPLPVSLEEERQLALRGNRDRALAAWTAAVARVNLERYVAAVEAARAESSHALARDSGPRATMTPVSGATGSVNGHPCGGPLPSCAVLARESHGTNVQNPDGRSASGYWQIQDETWNGFGGYARAVDAPPEVQDAKAASLAKCNWSPPRYCG
jgi:hypothetical protein